MPLTQDDYIKEAERLAKDDAGILKTPDYIACVIPGLRTYSDHRPLTVALDVPGTGGDVPVSSLTGFEDGYSKIVSVEYPISAANADESFFDEDDYKLIRTPTGLKVRFLGGAIPTTASGRFTFTKRPVLNATTNTVPDVDFTMLSKFIAAEAVMQLSRHYKQTMEKSFMQADIAFYGSKRRECEFAAMELRKEALARPVEFLIA